MDAQLQQSPGMPESDPKPSPEPSLVRRIANEARDVLTDVRESLFRHDFADTFKTRSEIMFSYLLLHVMPVKVHRRSLKAATTLGLGVISLFLFGILTATGIVLMFHYIPSATITDSGLPEAFERMLNLRSNVGYGPFLRNMHRWCAHGMVAIVVMHMARVFLMGSYKKPRQFNWVIGMLLMLLTLLASYTGYLLPWDQLSLWGVRVGTEIAKYAPGGDLLRAFLLGDTDVGQEALLRFYVLHCVVLPMAIAGLVALHFWRIRKDGGLARADEDRSLSTGIPAEQSADDNRTGSVKSYQLVEVMRGRKPLVDSPIEDLVFSWPALILRIAIVCVLCLIVASIFSLAFDAPLEEPANPMSPPNPAKAPWYFLGLQELVGYNAFIGGILLPGVAFAFFLILPYIDRRSTRVGVWFARERWVENGLFILFVLVNILLIVIGVYFRGANWDFQLPWEVMGGH
jgi:cytochrome b-561